MNLLVSNEFIVATLCPSSDGCWIFIIFIINEKKNYNVYSNILF